MPLLAYMLTWTTYGTRVHGDDRGSVDDSHNLPGTPTLNPDPSREARAARSMVESPFLLDAEMRCVVEQAIHDHAKKRNWQIGAVNVRSNHVHVLVTAPGYKPEIVVGQLKSWSTRRLRDSGLIGDRKHVWTKMASTRYVNTNAARIAAADYIVNHQ